MDLSEQRIRMNQAVEIKRKRYFTFLFCTRYFLHRFERFASYINLNAIQNQTLILPDVLQSIHTYWVLKRQVIHHYYSFFKSTISPISGKSWSTIDRSSRRDFLP